MHCVNSSIWYSSFLKAPWISTANKIRLLEWKGRLDLAMYASRRSPTPLLDDIAHYLPKEAGKPGSQSWDAIIKRVIQHPDDGHAAKLVRAIAHGEQISKPYEGSEKFRIKDGMWLQLGNMGELHGQGGFGSGGLTIGLAIDSVEDASDNNAWVRSAGFAEAWEK